MTNSHEDKAREILSEFELQSVVEKALQIDIANALLAAEQLGIERAAKLIEEGFDREHAEIWAKDGVTKSKFDKCAHGRQVNDDCEQCCSVAIRSLLPIQPEKGSG